MSRGKEQQMAYYTRVEEKVNFIYDLTKDKEYVGGFNIGDRLLQDVAYEIVKRGAIERTQIKGHGKCFKYKWVASSAPTKVFCVSIMNALKRVNNIKAERQKEKKNAQKLTKELRHEPRVVEPENTATPNDAIYVNPEMQIKHEPVTENNVKDFAISHLSQVSSKDLWNELKNRGFTIEDNHLVVVQKVIFE